MTWQCPFCKRVYNYTIPSCGCQVAAPTSNAVELAATDSQQLNYAIAEMSRAVMCLAAQVPESVWADVSAKWSAVVAQMHN